MNGGLAPPDAVRGGAPFRISRAAGRVLRTHTVPISPDLSPAVVAKRVHTAFTLESGSREPSLKL